MAAINALNRFRECPAEQRQHCAARRTVMFLRVVDDEELARRQRGGDEFSLPIGESEIPPQRALS